MDLSQFFTKKSKRCYSYDPQIWITFVFHITRCLYELYIHIPHPWWRWLFVYKFASGYYSLLGCMAIQQNSKPLFRLQKLSILYVDGLYRRGKIETAQVNVTGQLFERALSWNIVTWCNISWEKNSNHQMGFINYRSLRHLATRLYGR